ncbi:DUF3833 domain-containing protein [Photobacterium angustum]|uniref:DUF3833 domain-containing protein n=1 Tax=Photobacterium angustum (strain S14 / CCUG 15956) TaxID=314292 RepID=Q1ZVP2_PHOAS|nr:DUF3833 domain-containing protein [Photobacterium angustum]EAS66018.1 hypothetical protein VAS14_11914 [Photobacterium angustum S14]
MKKITSILLALMLLLAGCTASISDYKSSQPKFDLFGYFNGKTTAWGMLQDYKGKQTRRFTVDIVGTVKNSTLTLVEDFVFDDGETQQRIWTIEKQADGRYTGTAGDVIGEAQGVEVGNALQWQYTLAIPVDDSVYNIKFNDWMYRQDEKHMFNVATMTKFGFEVGKVTLFFQKDD